MEALSNSLKLAMFLSGGPAELVFATRASLA